MKSAKIGFLFTILICVLTFYSNVRAIPGDLDTAFDTDGKNTTSIGLIDSAKDVAIQADGKIVVAGSTQDGTSPLNLDLALVRYNADGSLDTSFGTGGKVFIAESGNQRANSVVIQADGKIIAFGSDANQLAAFRFNANGSVDTTFGTNGKVVHVISLESVAEDAVLQSDGKFVLAGSILFSDESIRFTVFRLNSNGSLDTGFNLTGYTSAAVARTAAYCVTLQSDGKIVAGGRDTFGNSRGFFGRFSTNGILEGGVDALVQTDVQINASAVQSNGKLVFGGYIRNPGTGISNQAVTQYNSDRTLDVHFGNGGVNTVNWTSGSQHEVNSLLIQPSGRIIVGGRALFPSDFGLARFNTHGFLDLGFGNNGTVTTNIGTGFDEITALVQQPDGKIVAVGQTSIGSGSDYAIARYDAGDTSTLANRAQFDYDGDGRADVSVFRPSTSTWYILNSGNASVSVRAFGISGDLPIPADFDGDSKTDIAIYRNGNWWYSLSGGAGNSSLFPWVVSGEARPGDFTGDGRADLIAFGSGVWSRRNSSTSTISNVNFGIAGDKAVLGDFDGDAKTDPAIYRPSTGEWWYAASSASGQQRAARWGIASDIPVPADYDGDFKTDFAVYRPSTGVWYIFNSSDGSFTIMSFGLAEDKPVAADYDGDGRADIAVFRPSTGVWYLMRSTAGFAGLQFGISTDIPTPNAFVP